MEPVVQISPKPGLSCFTVPGLCAAGAPREEPERTAFAYVPYNGCFHPKQTPVLFVLRDDSSEESARELVAELELDQLAERTHMIVVMPNATDEGWNYRLDLTQPDDRAYLAACFSALKKSVGVSGFNGMMFWIGCTEAASALIWNLALETPCNAAGIMVGAFPKGFIPIAGPEAAQVAWLYERNPVVLEYLRAVDDGSDLADYENANTDSDVFIWVSKCNVALRVGQSRSGLTARIVRNAWDDIFGCIRRWRNDTSGTYQHRIDFCSDGFELHERDLSLGLGDGIARTWLEFVPERSARSDGELPLVIFFHGVNCCGTYGAEQSEWSRIAKRDGFAAVFPNATFEDRWNIWDDKRLPSDVQYICSLIDWMANKRGIDRHRVYLSGFSMGSRFCNALACSYPELFAGVVACNGANSGYFETLDQSRETVLGFRSNSVVASFDASGDKISKTRAIADDKLEAGALRMPFVQFVGLDDGAGFRDGRKWPVAEGDEDCLWARTVSYWKQYNNISDKKLFSESPTGFYANHYAEEGSDCRFLHQWWDTINGEKGLYHFIAVKRMPHAVDARSMEIGWNIIKHFSRNPDGSLTRR